MINESKAIMIINKYLTCSSKATKSQYIPVAASQIYGDAQLCERLIDLLGDVYVCTGFDENYEENACGAEIQEAITFLAFHNRKT